MFAELRLDGGADVARCRSLLPQSYRQVFGPVGLHQRHFTGSLVGQFDPQGAGVGRRRLSLRLELLLKLGHVHLLRSPSTHPQGYRGMDAHGVTTQSQINDDLADKPGGRARRPAL